MSIGMPFFTLLALTKRFCRLPRGHYALRKSLLYTESYRIGQSKPFRTSDSAFTGSLLRLYAHTVKDLGRIS